MHDKIGHYTIVSKLGRGGMGVVYKAHEESLNRYVAIKLLGEHLIEDEQFLARFTREAQSAAGLSHPNIVQIYFIGQDEDRHYFVMEYVSGKPLDAIIHSAGRIEDTHAAQIILQAAQGLAAAHDNGIIHRDIKPANLIVDQRGIVKITDFGLALPSQMQSRLTATGMLMGTPGYMAPEQAKGEQADHRTDIYALGVTLYEMLTGNVPFKAESPLVLLKQIMEEHPPDVSSINPEVDRELITILDRMIAKERDDRFQSAHELIEALENYLSARGVRTMTKDLAGLVVIGASAEGSVDPTVALDGPTQPPAEIPPPPPPAPANVPTEAGVTAPSIESQAPPTVPVEAPPSPAPPPQGVQPAASGAPTSQPPPPVPQGSKSSWLPWILAILFLFILSGGALAAWMYFAGDRTEESEMPETVASTVETDRPVVDDGSLELSAPIETDTTIVTEDEGRTPVSGLDDPEAGTRKDLPPTDVERPRARSEAAADKPAPQVRSEPSPVSKPQETVLKGVTVAVTGDQGLTQYVADALMRRFEAMDVNASDARFLPEMESLVRGDPSTGALVDAARDAGVRLMVLARVEPTGERQLNYMGRSQTAFSSRINLTLIDVSNGRPLGRTRSESVEYTSLNAEREAQKALRKIGREIAEDVRDRRE